MKHKKNTETRSIDEPFVPSVNQDEYSGQKSLSEATERFVKNHLLPIESIEKVGNFDNQFVKRLHLSDTKIDLFQNKLHDQKIEMKPVGLWYGINDSWIDWCKSEMPHWFSPFIYEVILDHRYIKTIRTLEEFDDFEKEYEATPSHLKGLASGGIMNHSHINYPLLAAAYAGIEIAPYLYDRRFSSMHYYGWDCASGCIWHDVAIKKLRLFAKYSEKQDEFILQR